MKKEYNQDIIFAVGDALFNNKSTVIKCINEDDKKCKYDEAVAFLKFGDFDSAYNTAFCDSQKLEFVNKSTILFEVTKRRK